MTQTSTVELELEERRDDLSRKHVTEKYILPNKHVSDVINGTSSTGRPTRTKKQNSLAKIQFTACCVPLFLAGWNDGTQGPLLPRIQAVYNVGFILVSLIFVLACVGSILGALINVPLSDKLGFGKVIVIGSLFQVVAYSLMAPALPFPVLVLAYTINGIGLAMQDAQANGYVASLDTNKEAMMGLLHAVYGAGALCSPLVSTQFAQIRNWSFHYLVSLGLSVINSLVLIFIFRFKFQDECLAEIGQHIPERTASDRSTFRQILNHKTVHLLSFYILVYVGVEVTLGGWIVTFIIQERHGGPSSGYISAGFFGGLTTGRIVLLWVNKKIGERRVIFLYALMAIALEIVVWLVPSLIGNAVAVSIVGMLLGPMYPITMNHASRVLPRWILTGSIGWIAAVGQAGSAVLPFITGVISSKFGIKSLQPFVVAMMGAMIIMWAIVPGGPRRAE